MKCVDCKYFHQMQGWTDSGECRFNPPQWATEGDCGDNRPQSWFPNVKNEDWCGQFKGRVEVPFAVEHK